MFRKFLAAILIAFLPLTACANVKLPFKSIQQLGDRHPDGSLHNFCTAWATRYQDSTVWLSAYHCLEKGEDESLADLKYEIGGKPVRLEKGDAKADLVMFRGGPSAQPLNVSFSEAEMGQKVYAFLYFFAPNGMYVEGVASTLNDEGATIAYSMPMGPGASGGPVMTQGHTVVGIARFTGCPQMPCAVGGGPSVKTIRAFLGTTIN